MHAQFEREWERLGELAFRRQEKVAELFRALWRLIDAHPEHPELPWVLLLKDWMLVPFTLWPLDIAGLAREVNRLHKARGMKRQGPKMSEGRLERRLQARQAYEASQAARKAQLKGAKRLRFIAERCGLRPDVDPRVVRRLIQQGRGV